MAWYELSTERPVGMAEGFIPHSKIKNYGEDDLGLVGDELSVFIAIIRRVDNSHMSAKTTSDPELKDQVAAGDAEGVKGIMERLAASKDKAFHTKKPRVRHPRS